MDKLKPVDYPPGRPGVAIQRLKKSHPRLATKPLSRQHKPLRYNDQLPLPGFD